MDFLADENFPAPSVHRLREAGHVVSAIASEEPGISDERVLDRAVVESRVILTFDRDYGQLIFDAGLPPPPGVVYFRFVPAFLEEPAERLLDILEKTTLSILGNFTVVERDRLRKRTLPPPP
ncbi:MAG: DUF5615 family PIN-like protein [Rubrobacter sp.]|jgi:predicted nuclease of predicted toxin-antitoxin system|nr:DUF5615 family PIN-like protein [Rubrobacter sp.]